MFRRNRLKRHSAVEELASAAGERFQDLREGARELYDEGREAVARAAHRARDYVIDRPVVSLLAAFGAGALLGFLWKRR